LLAFVRKHPLLFAAYILAATIGVFLLALVVTVAAASIRNSTPTGFAGHAAEFYGHNPHLHPFGGDEIDGISDRLLGVTEAEGVAMLLACTDDKWKFRGRVGHRDSESNEYEFTRCDIADKSLIAISWVGMGFEGVEFAACEKSLCPDFVLGKYIGEASNSGRPFKLRTSEQDLP
jgi:hypothetical protein